MFEFDEFGELAWVPLALFAAVMAWRSRSALLAGLGEGGRLVRRDGPTGLPGNWIISRAGPVIQWVQGTRQGCGNQSFDAYRTDVLRKLKEERHEFRAFLKRLHQARDQAEFDAFMAERGR